MKTWVVVTGDSSGLGETIVKTLLDKGMNVIGISRKTSKLHESWTRDSRNAYRHVEWDLSHIDRMKTLYTTVLKSIGHIGGLVNNAAIAYDDLVTNAEYRSLDNMLRLNLLAPMMLTKYVIRDMILNEVHGSIVHISSICAHTGYSGLSMYGATKGGLEAYSKGIAREWGKKGIRSNCVSPGFMETRMSSSLSSGDRTKILRRASLGQMVEMGSVAALVHFLLTDDATSITGQTIIVDAGSL